MDSAGDCAVLSFYTDGRGRAARPAGWLNKSAGCPVEGYRDASGCGV